MSGFFIDFSRSSRARHFWYRDSSLPWDVRLRSTRTRKMARNHFHKPMPVRERLFRPLPPRSQHPKTRERNFVSKAFRAQAVAFKTKRRSQIRRRWRRKYNNLKRKNTKVLRWKEKVFPHPDPRMRDVYQKMHEAGIQNALPAPIMEDRERHWVKPRHLWDPPDPPPEPELEEILDSQSYLFAFNDGPSLGLGFSTQVGELSLTLGESSFNQGSSRELRDVYYNSPQNVDVSVLDQESIQESVFAATSTSFLDAVPLMQSPPRRDPEAPVSISSFSAEPARAGAKKKPKRVFAQF